MTQNLHTHTTFCDGKNTPEEMVQSAISLGMDSLGFSGHAPMSGPNGDWTMDESDIPQYRAEVLRLRGKYSNQIEIFLGLEQDFDSTPQIEPWDYVIGSVHQVQKGDAWLPVDASAEDFVRAVEQHYAGDYFSFAEDYYRRVGEIVDRTGCQIVGHFDLITKFDEGDKIFDTGHSRYVSAALEALDRLAEQDVIFEINTGAISRGYRSAPYPSPTLLRAMRERDIPICITSDSHSAAAILHAFPQAAELAWTCGYREQMVLTRRGFVPTPLKRGL